MSTDHHPHSSDSNQDGLWLLKQPILPLVRIVQFLYITGPFKNIASIVDQLTEPIETGTGRYENPAALLKPYLPVIRQFEVIKSKQCQNMQPVPTVVDEQLRPVGRILAVQLWVSQQVLTVELERINSRLCGPCSCVICCTGPDYGVAAGPDRKMKQHFFEIPLTEKEIELFDELPKIDTEQSRKQSANSEPSLIRDGKPFYEAGQALYHWKKGWGLILPRQTACPRLDEEKHICRIYQQRPEVCKRPQVFAYALERHSDHERKNEGKVNPVYTARQKLLAVWDCPYVRELKEEIIGYAEMCGMEPVFMENKE